MPRGPLQTRLASLPLHLTVFINHRTQDPSQLRIDVQQLQVVKRLEHGVKEVCLVALTRGQRPVDNHGSCLQLAHLQGPRQTIGLKEPQMQALPIGLPQALLSCFQEIGQKRHVQGKCPVLPLLIIHDDEIAACKFQAIAKLEAVDKLRMPCLHCTVLTQVRRDESPQGPLPVTHLSRIIRRIQFRSRCKPSLLSELLAHPLGIA